MFYIYYYMTSIDSAFSKKKKKSIEHLISLQINVRYF